MRMRVLLLEADLKEDLGKMLGFAGYHIQHIKFHKWQ